jgi:hypothetical protein
MCVASTAAAQSWAVDDPVLRAIWDAGMNRSQIPEIAQTLMDSLGPRLTGTAGLERANDWSVDLLRSWGVDARKEQYGTWLAWERGPTHIDLIRPRVRTLEGAMLSWSGGTNGPGEGEVIVFPGMPVADLQAWLPAVRGKYVAISPPQVTCRPDSDFTDFGTPGALERLQSSRSEALQPFAGSPSAAVLRTSIEAAGALGVLESTWSGATGANRVHSTNIGQIPSIDLSCEDYGLLWRLAENRQGPAIRLDAQARDLGEAPVYNTIAVIRGRELPNEYVILSAHFDSWDSASGATDNGTGSTVMLEAMRLLAEAYPNPRRTILLGLWGGEEQGLHGSRRFAAANPGIVEGVQALFNQDEGTGRVERISTQGLLDSGSHLTAWLARIPREITQSITLDVPGLPSPGSSDHASFICSGAPVFYFSSRSWDYGTQTWHTNRDTYDKVVTEEVRSNAVLTAMLAYLASEDPDRVGRDRRVMPNDPQGDAQPWPTCAPGRATAR